MLTCVGQHEEILQGPQFMTSYLADQLLTVSTLYKIASFTYVKYQTRQRGSSTI